MDPIPYDPVTCVTAAELRSKGVAVTSDIPDHAWIPKKAVEPVEKRIPSDDGEPLYSFDVIFHAPFTWQEDPTHDQVCRHDP
jgi:hypothetical protein